MPDIWTAPRTWTTGEVVTSTLMNTHLRDNLEHLKARVETPAPSASALSVASYSTSSTSFVDVDATNLSLALTTTGAPVLFGFSGSVNAVAGGVNCYFDLLLDGARISGGSSGSLHVTTGTAGEHSAVCFIGVRALAAGAHTVRLQWRVGSSTATFGSVPLGLFALEMR